MLNIPNGRQCPNQDIDMIPTPRYNTTTNAMAYTNQSSLGTSPSPERSSRHIDTPILSTPIHAHSADTSSLGTLSRLPPEIRNNIYSLVLTSPRAMFIVPAKQWRGAFHLREQSDTPSYEAVEALQTLGAVSRNVRQEVRTLFYATKHFIVLGYNYEYLPVFVRWLEVIGAECRAALRNLCLAGYMWYQPSISLTTQLHDQLRSCLNLHRLTVQINIRHLCESCLPNLMAYLNYMDPEPYDGPLPLIDVAAWAKTIVSMPKLNWFRLDLVMSVDEENTKLCRERIYEAFSSERGRVLAEDFESSLKKEIELQDPGRIGVVQVRYGGGDERSYHGAPW
jgi:hypothetical protein